MSIVTERDPMVVGIPNEVVCSTRELGVSAIEMIFPETNKTLATANDTSRLATNLVPAHSLKGKDILCRVYTADDLEFENTHTIQIAGEHAQVSCIEANNILFSDRFHS